MTTTPTYFTFLKSTNQNITWYSDSLPHDTLMEPSLTKLSDSELQYSHSLVHKFGQSSLHEGWYIPIGFAPVMFGPIYQNKYVNKKLCSEFLLKVK